MPNMREWIRRSKKWAALAAVAGVVASQGTARGDELILPREAFAAMGYASVGVRVASTDFLPDAFLADLPRDLPWPVRFADAAHTVAQNYVNFQEYGDGQPYFHGGCDLRAAGNSDVIAPVAGILEGGYYGYSTNEDGSMEKHWKPWAGQANRDPYFELAIVTDDGYRLELHHVDAQKLPAATIQALNQGNVRVEAGTVVGRVNGWAFASQRYDHIHYNVVRADGVRLNPEFYSTTITDRVAPRIQGVYAIRKDGRAELIRDGASVTGSIQEIVVAATESRDGDAYVQTPPVARIQFGANAPLGWDFRQFLLTEDHRWPDLREVFRDEIEVAGRRYSTWGQYGQGLFLMRLPVTGQIGPFEVRIEDTAGNVSRFHAVLSGI